MNFFVQGEYDAGASSASTRGRTTQPGNHFRISNAGSYCESFGAGWKNRRRSNAWGGMIMSDQGVSLRVLNVTELR
jgi:hypothetical protein